MHPWPTIITSRRLPQSLQPPGGSGHGWPNAALRSGAQRQPLGRGLSVAVFGQCPRGAGCRGSQGHASSGAAICAEDKARPPPADPMRLTRRRYSAPPCRGVTIFCGHVLQHRIVQASPQRAFAAMVKRAGRGIAVASRCTATRRMSQPRRISLDWRSSRFSRSSAFSFAATSDGMPGVRPASRSAFFTQSSSVCGEQSILPQ
jgi:hypothetical protein